MLGAQALGPLLLRELARDCALWVLEFMRQSDETGRCFEIVYKGVCFSRPRLGD